MPTLADAPPPYRTIVFDCDSTLSAIEGIDELAGEHKPEIAELTARAMRGEIALESVYGLRLERIRPTAAQLERVGQQYVEELVPGARELADALRFLGKRVCIVSGGIEGAVLCVAHALGLAKQDVFSVRVDFGADGAYTGFDERSPLARSGGKIEIVKQLAREAPGGPLALVGDGITDLEAAEGGAAARFVAFGGVVRRAEVFQRAAITAAQADLACVLPLLVSEREMRILSRSREHERFAARARTLTPTTNT